MPKINDIHSVIVPAQSPVFSAHMYTEIYGGTSGCAANINGTIVNVAAQSSISIWVRSISGGTGCYLLGDNQNVYQGSSGIGGIY